MNNIEKLRAGLQQLLDKADDKEMIGELTTISNSIDDVESDYQKIQSDYKDVLDSYKEMVKHTSLKVEKNETNGLGQPEKKSLDDIIANAIKEIKGN